MTDDRPAISASALTRSYGRVLAVDRLDLEVRHGEVFGLLGHNGAGKTTTVRMLNGILDPSAGKAQVLGFDPSRQGSELRRRTGVATETPSLDDRLTGRHTLRLFAELYGLPAEEVEARVEGLLLAFDLAGAGDDRIGSYSKGMRQRLALARALLHDPELLFLDEPTSGLDPVATREVERLVRHLSREEGKTILLCTHNLVQAQSLCDRVAVLERGRLIAHGTPAELAARYGGARRVRVEVAEGEARRAQRHLADGFGEVEAGLEPGVLVVWLSDREAVPELVAALVREGVPVYGVRMEEASLEEVYFAIHGRSGEER